MFRLPGFALHALASVGLGSLLRGIASPAPAPVRRRPSAPRRPPVADVDHGRRYLAQRSLHPDRASSVRKMQRAFRRAGTSFDPKV